MQPPQVGRWLGLGSRLQGSKGRDARVTCVLYRTAAALTGEIAAASSNSMPACKVPSACLHLCMHTCGWHSECKQVGMQAG